MSQRGTDFFSYSLSLFLGAQTCLRFVKWQHVTAMEWRDVSRLVKAVSCHRTPKPEWGVWHWLIIIPLFCVSTIPREAHSALP